MAAQLASALFWLGFAGLLAVWIAYPATLWLAAQVLPRKPVMQGAAAKTVTVLIAAHNEAGNITSRLENIAGTGSRDFHVSVLVALDHCTDDTGPLIDAWTGANPGLPVSKFATLGRGKAMAHNEAVPMVTADLVIFSDADTIFEEGFIDRIAHAFDDPRVGYCSGVLTWRGKTTAQGASNFPLYWRFETWLRILESRLGICAVGTGACSAMRPQLFMPLHPTSDSDCSTPLDVVQKGYLCTIEPLARAADFVADTVEGEFRARVRMTAKNFVNTVASWNWRVAVFRYPAVTAGLLLHKLGRWLTPYLALSLLCGGTVLFWTGGTGFASAVTIAGYAGLLAAAIGFFVPGIPVLGALGSFAMANAAFALGVFKALTGRVPTSFGKS